MELNELREEAREWGVGGLQMEKYQLGGNVLSSDIRSCCCCDKIPLSDLTSVSRASYTGSRGASVSLSFLASRGHLHSLAHGPIHLHSQIDGIFQSLALTLIPLLASLVRSFLVTLGPPRISRIIASS